MSYQDSSYNGNIYNDPNYPAQPQNVFDSTSHRHPNNPFHGPDSNSVYANSAPYTEPSRRVSQVPLDPSELTNGSDETLANNFDKFSFSSYRHPAEISVPPNVYPGEAPLSPSRQPPRSSYRHPAESSVPPNVYPGETPLSPSRQPPRSSIRRSVSFAQGPDVREYAPEEVADDNDDDYKEDYDPEQERALKRRGIPSQMLDLYALNQQMKHRHSSRSDDSDDYPFQSTRPNFRHVDSMMSNNSELMDEDDPRLTGVKAKYLEDPRDIEKNILRQMDYRSRRKHLMRVKIEFNVTSMVNRQEFLIKLARALMTFGAPSHRIESQLVAAARILEVEAEFIHLPGVIICSFGDQDLGCSETHFVKCGGRLSLGALHKVHVIYRSVVHDEVSAKEASNHLEELLHAPPLYSSAFRCLLSFCLSALICPLAFGGSFLDMWIAGLGALIMALLQLCATKSALYANVFEITVAIFVSFAARGLSSIRSRIFCYTAISSAGIIGILPGYLILSSSLELASKNIVCGSVKMVYALIYTLFLGFGLQIGSDFYLLIDRSMRRKLDSLSSSLATAVTLTGSWVADNSTDNTTLPVIGTFTFTHAVPLNSQDIIEGCYRPKHFPWYLKRFPTWTAFLIVPTFSLLSSLANLQPLKSKQLPVMVVISCASYASNKIANHYIFNRSDVVSAIGAFTVGVLGNVYSRKMGGTAFTSMVTGVLFLVPSGLSQAGGITANGNGIDIGGAMIAVTIGITVGLFMSQALVYMFGTRKNAAVFSF